MLLTILDSFLSNRFSRNLVNGYVSEWLESNYGLPQGSILSPVLCLVFTGDLSADPAKSNYNFLIAPLNIHLMNPSIQMTATYGKAATT